MIPTTNVILRLVLESEDASSKENFHRIRTPEINLKLISNELQWGFLKFILNLFLKNYRQGSITKHSNFFIFKFGMVRYENDRDHLVRFGMVGLYSEYKRP